MSVPPASAVGVQRFELTGLTKDAVEHSITVSGTVPDVSFINTVPLPPLRNYAISSITIDNCASAMVVCDSTTIVNIDVDGKFEGIILPFAAYKQDTALVINAAKAGPVKWSYTAARLNKVVARWIEDSDIYVRSVRYNEGKATL